MTETKINIITQKKKNFQQLVTTNEGEFQLTI